MKFWKYTASIALPGIIINAIVLDAPIWIIIPVQVIVSTTWTYIFRYKLGLVETTKLIIDDVHQ